MARAWTLARKELRDILRERSLIMALLTQFFVAAFSAFLTIGLVSLYDPDALAADEGGRIAYVGPGGFLTPLRQAEGLRVMNTTSDAALDLFSRGRVDAIVEESYASDASTRTVTILIPRDELRTPTLVVALKELLREYEDGLRQGRADRIDQDLLMFRVEERPDVPYEFGAAVLVPLLVLTPVFLSGAITGDAIVQELRTGTFHLLRASPLRPAEFLWGKMMVPLLAVPAQVTLWMALLWMNGLPVHNLLALAGVGLVFALVLCSAGAALSILARHEGQAQAGYALLVLVLFVGGLLLPQDPLNLLARIAADTADASSLLALAAYFAAGGLAFAAAADITRRRFRRETHG